MMGFTSLRQPHAVMDLPSRNAKGLKIERLLKLAERKETLRLLDVGTGSGGIAHYFSTHSVLQCEVTSVDVVDQRKLTDGYSFILLEGAQLPFDDACFDVVISNHVIEHVGERPDQGVHLREIRRVLSPGGLGYLAVPNRWMIMEPHYRVPFLSWLPRKLRTSYLKLTKKGVFYDCEPLSVPELEQLVAESGLTCRHLHLESIRETFSIEGAKGWVRCIDMLPDCMLMPLKRITPTLIYQLEHSHGPSCFVLSGNGCVDSSLSENKETAAAISAAHKNRLTPLPRP